MGFEDKVALVTGAGSGIGRATATRFAGRGARVLAVDAEYAAASETVRRIRDLGHGTRVEALGAVSPSDIEAAVNHAVQTYGALHFAVNNFSPESDFCELHEMDEQGWNRILHSALTSTWLAMKYQVPAIRNSGGGAIVNVASLAGITSSPGLSALGAAKAGVISLSRSAAAELAPHNIRVNAISPGAVLTDGLARLCDSEPGIVRPLVRAHPVGRLAQPDEIATCICFLCSDEASFMSGDNMVVDGGGGTSEYGVL